LVRAAAKPATTVAIGPVTVAGRADRMVDVISHGYARCGCGTPIAQRAGMAATMKALLAATLCVTTFGCDAGETVGPRGGVITSDDGRVSLEIPEGALDSDVAITIEVVDDAPAGVIGTVYAIEPAGLAFARPATLVVDVSADEEDRAFDLAAAGVEVEDLVILGERDNRWQPLPDPEVDADDEFVFASVLYLSSYAISSRS
jgi:hypothetical protein